jgi:hypothetical protein
MCALTCCVVFADAFQVLRILPKQLAVLQASEEETRQVRLGGMKDSTPPYCLSCDASVWVGEGGGGEVTEGTTLKANVY